MRNDIAWHGTKIYILKVLRSMVLKRCHDIKQVGHYGFLKTLHLAKRQFWWPGMRSDIEHYVKSCPVCIVNKTKVGKPTGLLQSVAEPTKPWQDIGMDFIVDLPDNKGYTGYPLSEMCWVLCADVSAPRLHRQFHKN
ncbi:hypothetical protein E2320_001481 [Naja naja]|nr:hypothetical protein E2320_001481 [Naja naja]